MDACQYLSKSPVFVDMSKAAAAAGSTSTALKRKEIPTTNTVLAEKNEQPDTKKAKNSSLFDVIILTEQSSHTTSVIRVRDLPKGGIQRLRAWISAIDMRNDTPFTSLDGYSSDEDDEDEGVDEEACADDDEHDSMVEMRKERRRISNYQSELEDIPAVLTGEESLDFSELRQSYVVVAFFAYNSDDIL